MKTVKKKATVKKVNKPKATKAKAKKQAVKKSTSKASKKTNKKPATKKKTTNTKKKETKKVVKKNTKVITKPKKKVVKEVIQKSTEASTVKMEAETGIYDDHGNWNGSTFSDQVIENTENEEEKRLLKEIDNLQEEVKRARENGEDPVDISNMVIELSRLRAQLTELKDKR